MHSMQLTSLAVALFALSSSVTAAVPKEPGWRTVWGDDFSGPSGSLPNKNRWRIATGTSYPGGPANWGTGEIQTYTASTRNVYVSKSGLHIKPLRSKGGAWTSGRIESRRGDFVPKKGKKMKMTARLSLPDVGRVRGKGYWPAFWAMGSKFRGNYTNWPAVGEFDIAETVNGMNTVVSAFHCGVNPGGYCNEPVGLGAQLPCPRSGCNGHFHTYSVILDRSTSPESLKFFADGVLHKSISSNDMDAKTWDSATHFGHYIILNVAMGGSYPNAADVAAGGNGATPTTNTAPGKDMVVKYVAVYEQ